MTQILITIAFVFVYSLQASAFSFDELSEDEFRDVNKDFAAAFIHTTVSPVEPLLAPKSWEVGLLLGMGTTPNVKELAESDDESDVPTVLPNLGIIAVYSHTEKISYEFKLLPDLAMGEMGLGSQSLAVKFSDINKGQLHTAWRLQFTNTYLRVYQNINNASTGNTDVPAKIGFLSQTLGAIYMAGGQLKLENDLLVSPFMGIGATYTMGSAKVEADTSASIFPSQESSMSASSLAPTWLVGVQLHKNFTKFALEYNRVFDSDKINLKLSFGY